MIYLFLKKNDFPECRRRPVPQLKLPKLPSVTYSIWYPWKNNMDSPWKILIVHINAYIISKPAWASADSADFSTSSLPGGTTTTTTPTLLPSARKRPEIQPGNMMGISPDAGVKKLGALPRNVIPWNTSGWWFQWFQPRKMMEWKSVGIILPNWMESHSKFHGSSHHQPDIEICKSCRLRSDTSEIPSVTMIIPRDISPIYKGYLVANYPRIVFMG